MCNSWPKWASVFLLLVAATWVADANAQSTDRFEAACEHLRFGEFAKALEIASELDSEQADQIYSAIAVAQSPTRIEPPTAVLEKISDDQVRFRAVAQLQFLGGAGPPVPIGGFGGQPLPPLGAFNGQPGLSGGVTEADFFPLMNLIRSTIDPDSWDDANGEGTMQAYPAGVYVDSTGTLNRLNIDPNRSLGKIARQAERRTDVIDCETESELRKISLIRLEKAVQFAMLSGQALDPSLQNLAGLYEIKYLIRLPQSNDIVIAGGAGPWRTDVDGHCVNIKTGKPVLQLDDLVVCLRNAQPTPLGNHGKFGCSITPRRANLAATQSFVSTSTLRGSAWRNELRKALGQQDIEVFGIDPATHAALALVEADYRMKLVAMGLEPSIPEVPSYLSRLGVDANGLAAPMDVVRWWFTMNYDEIRTDPSRQIFELVGTGVKVLSENEFINQQGDRIHTGKSDGPTAGFARDFTRHFDKLAAHYPVYRRLKNLFDFSIVSYLIREEGWEKSCDWQLTTFGNDPDLGSTVYQPVEASVPIQVDSVMNHRVINERANGKTLKHTLVGVSGGIIFDAVEVVRQKSKVAVTMPLDQPLAELSEDQDWRRWWWD